MCDYCEKEKRIQERPNDNIYHSIYYKHFRTVGKLLGIPLGRDVLINYCPMCGRKLGE